MWAAEHGVDVTNNSYYTDPWYFNCKNDPDQKALVEAVTRASRTRRSKGTVNVAAAGNENYDLAADAITDPIQPERHDAGRPRTIDPPSASTSRPSCRVSSRSRRPAPRASSRPSPTTACGVIDVAAPGGDSTRYQTPGTAGHERPDPGHAAGRQVRLHGRYVDGVPACRGCRRADQVDAPARLGGRGEGAAVRARPTPPPCTDPYDIDGDGKIDAVCEGAKNHNGFYGAGVVDALDAVRR